MKLSDQVCTLRQAMRLKELGIAQEGLYTWLFSPLSGDWAISHQTAEALHILKYANPKSKEWAERKERGWYSAFTVAELGVMLPFNCISYLDCYHRWSATNDYQNPNIEFEYIGETECDARASLVISLLETGLLTAEEANKRLKA
ncbi:hypothetical protein ACFOTA_06740 [Chitinophaga sp. GCM10012297]|uniref:Uncharacterized protein n=1 Tax=Chitinophaga chungangae TaxID=2821488 RepID=A0ABS3YB39_9BACT|nr:hypothetical protein [Chitinophaga chungangae]MBO9151897.1 hypothetical protein [Chitinophaga chungangae]